MAPNVSKRSAQIIENPVTYRGPIMQKEYQATWVSPQASLNSSIALLGTFQTATKARVWSADEAHGGVGVK